MTEPKEPREFDLYISEDEIHVCENSVPWTEGCSWAKPDVHVREVTSLEDNAKKFTETEVALATTIIELENYKEIVEGLMGALEKCPSICGKISERYKATPFTEERHKVADECQVSIGIVAREAIDAARKKGMK